MSRRRKLIGRMQSSPGSIRFEEVAALLEYEGFRCVNRVGSHWSYQLAGYPALTVVRPHGGRNTCSRKDILKVLHSLGLS